MDKEAYEQTRLFEEYWFKIEKNLGSENISDFVRDYLTMKQNKIPNKSEVYEAFKHYVMSNVLKVEDLLEELYSYSKIYKTFINPENEIYAKRLQNFKFLKVSVVYPFLMNLIDLYNQQKIDSVNLLRSLEIIESYIVRRAICNQATNALNKVFASLYSDIIEIDRFKLDEFSKYLNAALVSKKGSAIFPNNDMFKNDFTSRDMYNIKNKQFFLGVLENRDNKERVDFINLSVEHYMPQTLTSAWKVHLGDNFQNIHSLYVHNIGNLSLTAHNSELGNKSYEEKKQLLKEQSRLKLNRFFISSETWSEVEIKKRANLLFEEAKEVWNYENLSIDILTNSEDKEFYTLEDNIDITGKKPIAFELNGIKHSVKSWKEVLVKTLKLLADIDFNMVKSFAYDSDFQGRVQRIISDKGDNIRQAEEIREDLYIETNLSANSILANIKLICEKFDLEDDSFIFYVK
ncbi:MAG: HNH endonuclease family protein [Sulfuricurvum sp.]